MKSKVKVACKACVFLLIGLLLFGMVQEILTPNWTWQNTIGSDAERTVNGLFELEKNTVEVLFVGSSQIHDGISPMKLYEDTGICAYNLSVSAQTLGASYQFMKQMFKTQSPSVIFLNVQDLFANEYEPSWRYIMDSLPFTATRIEIAKAYGENWPEEGEISVLLPLYKYHDRWSKLNSTDFCSFDAFGGLYYSAGQRILGTAVASGLTLDAINSLADTMLNMDKERLSDTHSENVSDAMLYKSQIPEKNKSVLEKMRDLCEENGAELVLLKVPSLALPQYDTRAWSRYVKAEVEQLAEELEISFVDLMYSETGVDFQTDTADGGTHLNIRGAEKVSAYLGEYLLTNFDVTQADNPQYNEMLEKYQIVRRIAMLQSETDFNGYLRILRENKEDWAILIAAQNEYTSAVGTYNAEDFVALGLEQILKGQFANAYVAAIDGGEVTCELLSGQRITHNTQTDNGAAVAVCSSGWYTNPLASIEINGVEYAANTEGLNIVVYDKATGLVVDSAWCNTRYENQTVGHLNPYGKLRAYESAVCFG